MNGCHIKPEQFFNLIFGYDDRYLEQIKDLSTPAGTKTLNGSTVPSGEVWVVTAATLRDDTSSVSGMHFGIYNGTTFYRMGRYGAATAEVGVEFRGHLVLKAGDNIRGIIYGCTLNDDTYLEINGYKMKLSQ